MPTLFLHPGSNYMLSATGVLSDSMSLEVSWGRAGNSLNYELQAEKLFRAGAGLTGLPLLFPDAVQADYIPELQFRGGRTDNAGQYQTNTGPFTNENITHDVLANLTKVWGPHASKVGFYYQNSYKPQSIFASFNGRINFINDANNPFDTGFSYANAATGVFNSYTQASKFAIPEWRYTNIEFYAQDNWRPTDRLTLDYGARFYYLTPQWDHTLQASNFLPDEFNASERRAAVPSGLHRRPSVFGHRPARHGSAARLARRDAHAGQHRRRSIHRPSRAGIGSVQWILPGRAGHQRGTAGRGRVQGVAAPRLHLRPDR